mmetsp:Transcript_66511/g.98572  ORF Transcript_66511/g.98572 Transcript_66511/m.98572 type:complete len:107 (-) Transcript_66511:837-1157(-)
MTSNGNRRSSMIRQNANRRVSIAPKQEENPAITYKKGSTCHFNPQTVDDDMQLHPEDRTNSMKCFDNAAKNRNLKDTEKAWAKLRTKKNKTYSNTLISVSSSQFAQ